MNNTYKILLLLALLAPSMANASAGKVLFSLGRVDIQRNGSVIAATRGMPVEIGDQLELGATGRTQIRLSDGALIALQPGTSFVIEDFQLPDAATITPTAQPVSAPATTSSSVAPTRVRAPVNNGGRALFSLLKGGFRTITGLIGKGDQDVYQLKTPVATIGIRGTDYSATYCSGNCRSTPNGLYVGVSNGEIVVTNNTGSLQLNDNQYSYVQGENAPPEKLLEPPADVLDPAIEDTGTEEEFGETDSPNSNATAEGGGSESPPPNSDSKTTSTTAELPGAEPDPRTLTTRLVAFSTGPIDTDAEFAGVSLNDASEIILGSGDELLAFRGASPSGGIADYTLNTAQNKNPGFDPATSLRWGRWSAGAKIGASTIAENLHWIFGAATLEQPVLPKTGSFNYQLVGNTDPTDSAGNVGFLANASFSACFSCGNSQSGLGTVQSNLDIGIANQVWSANGSGDITAGFPAFAGNYAVTGDGLSGTGSFAGFFVGPNNSSAPTGAGLSYSLNNGSTTVSGAAAFGNPTATTGAQ